MKQQVAVFDETGEKIEIFPIGSSNEKPNSGQSVAIGL
jgi:hypothetical protein